MSNTLAIAWDRFDAMKCIVDVNHLFLISEQNTNFNINCRN